jgi:hypothetical protein
MMKITVIVGVLLTLLPSSYGDIIFSGSIADNPGSDFEVGRWSRASTIKTFDIDGDNIYGTDGYILMNTSNDPAQVGPLVSSTASTPSYLSGISYSGPVANGRSGSHSNAAAILPPGDPGGANLNLGYAGIDVDTGGEITHQELFSYTLNRDMTTGETIRLGVIADSLADARVGVTSLSIVSGSDFAHATIVPNGDNALLDMYFFDISGLSNGDDIEIWGGKTVGGNGAFTWAAISGVTFDSVVIPEPSSLALLFIGACLLPLTRKISRS